MCVRVCVRVCMYVRIYVCITLLSVMLASGELSILLKMGSSMHMKPGRRQLVNRKDIA